MCLLFVCVLIAGRKLWRGMSRILARCPPDTQARREEALRAVEEASLGPPPPPAPMPRKRRRARQVQPPPARQLTGKRPC